MSFAHVKTRSSLVVLVRVFHPSQSGESAVVVVLPAPDAHIRVVVVRHARLVLLLIVDFDLTIPVVRVVFAALAHSAAQSLTHGSAVSSLGVEGVGGAPCVLPHISRFDEVGPLVDGGTPVPEPPACAVVQLQYTHREEPRTYEGHALWQPAVIRQWTAP